jgi:hypothetical protein
MAFSGARNCATNPHRAAPEDAPPPAQPPEAYADMGRWTLIDCNNPTATHTANIDEPP